MKPHVEIRRKNDTPFFQPKPNEPNWRSIPGDVRPTRLWTDGDRPVDLYQRGTFGSCLSCMRARAVWPTQGHFIATGAPRYYQASLFHGGTHQTVEFTELWAQSPLPIETFLHIGTWRTRYPKYHWNYSLEFNVAHSHVKGFLFEIDTLCRYSWSVETEWASDCAQLDLLELCDLGDRVSRIVWAMGYDWRHLPQACSPDYVHVQPPPDQSCAEPVRKAPRITHSREEEASFSIIPSESSDPSSSQSSDYDPIPSQHERQCIQRQQELQDLEEGDLDELWRSQYDDIY